MFGVPNVSLDPKLVRYELSKGVAAIRLFIEQPAEASMDGWYLVPRSVICMISGPGPDGTSYVFPRLGMPIPAGWEEAVAARGGAIVIFGGIDDNGPFAAFT